MSFQDEIATPSNAPPYQWPFAFQPAVSTPTVRDRPLPGSKLSLVFMGTETALLAAATCAAFLAIRPSTSLGFANLALLLGLPIVNTAILARRRFYALSHLLFAPLRSQKLIGAWFEAFGIAIVFSILVRCAEPARLHDINLFAPEIGAVFGLGLATLLATRLAWMGGRSRFASFATPLVLFIGALDTSRRLLARLHAESSIRLLFALDYRELTAGGDRLTALLAREAIDTVLVAPSQVPEAELASIAATAQRHGVSIVALPDRSLRRDLDSVVTMLGGLPVMQYGAPRLAPAAMVQKRAFDLIVGVAVLVAILPVMALIALSIRLGSPGPVLFRQLRVGRGGRLFEILKFRTMVDAMPDNAVPAAQEGLQTARNDKRVTRLGKFLRRHSFDELPQILNVLRGDMSIIGPRPHAAAMTVEGMALEALAPDYTARFAVRPGITGWAQVNGKRGIMDCADKLQARLDHDLYYIENWSLGFDVVILFRTFACILRDDQAF